MSNQNEFDFTRPRGITPAGETGMHQAADHAERVEPGWADGAFAALCDFVRDNAAPFTIEEMRARVLVASPTDERAWGGVVMRASRAGVIVRAGFAPAVSSHGSPKPLWRARA